MKQLIYNTFKNFFEPFFFNSDSYLLVLVKTKSAFQFLPINILRINNSLKELFFHSGFHLRCITISKAHHSF